MNNTLNTDKRRSKPRCRRRVSHPIYWANCYINREESASGRVGQDIKFRVFEFLPEWKTILECQESTEC